MAKKYFAGKDNYVIIGAIIAGWSRKVLVPAPCREMRAEECREAGLGEDRNFVYPVASCDILFDKGALLWVAWF